MAAILSLLWLGLAWVGVQIGCRLLPRPLPGGTSLALSALAVHVSTAQFNSLPARMLSLTGSRWKSEGRRWARVWDVGALLSLGGVLLAQATLVWAAWRALGAAWGTWSARQAALAAAELLKQQSKLSKRALAGGAPVGGAGDGLLLHALIPGVTTPLSTLPLLFFSLLSAQAFHELGHGLAAAAEAIPIVATGVHLHLLLPTAYVALPSTVGASHGPVTELRVATAGVAHNLVLCAAVTVALRVGDMGWGRRVWSREVEGGVMVVDVDHTSALYWHLKPGSVISNLDDLELDSTPSSLASFNSYLSPTSDTPSPTSHSYSSLGWCLPLSDFTAKAEACCLPHESIANLTSPRASSDHLLCFNTPTSTRTACLSPIPIFDPVLALHPPKRCVENSGCEEGRGCGWLKEGDKVLRIRLRDSEREGAKERLVVWEGDKRGVKAQVTVTDRVPRLWIVPYWAPNALSKWLASTSDLSLTLAFLNLLPLPNLDGAAIVSSFRGALLATSKNSLHSLEAGVDALDDGLLVRALGLMRRSGPVKKWVALGERADRWLARWTIAWGVVLLVGSGVVGMLSQK